MKTLDFGRCLFSAGAMGLLVAGCGGSQPLTGAPGTLPQTKALARPTALQQESSGYKVLASFDATSGTNPYGTLLPANGKLYGTTSGGLGSEATGTVFSVTPGGLLNPVYRFRGAPDGAVPEAGLVNVSGTLYGTTSIGGTHDAGTVFSIASTGEEKVLYSFGGGTDGATPMAPLTDVGGVLYGTTYGGSNDPGTVFSVTTDGNETVLHGFTGYPNDGQWSLAGLVYKNGRLYGTTSAGGTVKYGISGAGTVFSITPSGSEKVVYSFDPSREKGHLGNRHGDGFDPTAPLINAKGKLYGTTAYRGNRGAAGCGTAFNISASGAEKEVHAFHQVSGGCVPAGGLVKIGDLFYGTTSVGGAYNKGTLFSMMASGKETVLHSFGYGTDGSNPSGGLVDYNGTLYGMTSNGGNHGAGTVFALTP